MENYIIIATLAIVIGLGIYHAVNHFRGQGGCCGRGGYRPKKKRLRNIRYKRIFKLGGIRCKNCKKRVEETVNDISGISGRVNLKRSELAVYYEADVDDAAVKYRIERAGYTVIQICDKRK